ncbi:MAG: hypothetical protein H6871_08155 [Methylobacteriaceae bacterium]|nr:hypothetical protein [Methylobacteriaceae bacterium]
MDSSISLRPDTITLSAECVRRAHRQPVAGLDRVDRGSFDAVLQNARDRRPKRRERSDGATGGGRARLQPLAEQDEGDDERRRFEGQVMGVALRHAPQREPESGDRAQRDEHVHIGRAGAQGLVGADVKARACDENTGVASKAGARTRAVARRSRFRRSC